MTRKPFTIMAVLAALSFAAIGQTAAATSGVGAHGSASAPAPSAASTSAGLSVARCGVDCRHRESQPPAAPLGHGCVMVDPFGEYEAFYDEYGFYPRAALRCGVDE
jgi:hypothetical protein